MRIVVSPLALAIVGLVFCRGIDAQHATASDIEDGARAFANICANCHGPDGNLIPGIDLGRGLFRRPYTDDALTDIIRNGIPGVPMPGNPGMPEKQARLIVAYLRKSAANASSAQASGDPVRGRAIFEGKGGCLECHRVGAKGSPTGPDLSGIGGMRHAADLEKSILDPAAEVQANNRTYTVTTADNAQITGRLLNQDTFSVQLIDRDGRLRSFAKRELRAHGFTGTLMPSARGKLDAAEIADLVSYLVSLRP
jgi:putative heme-binding domain-containing protein